MTTTLGVIAMVLGATLVLVLVLDWMERRRRRSEREVVRRIISYLDASRPRPW